MITRQRIKEIAAGRADSAIATSSDRDDVPREVGESDWEFLAESLDTSPEALDDLEVDDDLQPQSVSDIFRRAYKRRLRQEFGEGYVP